MEASFSKNMLNVHFQLHKIIFKAMCGAYLSLLIADSLRGGEMSPPDGGDGGSMKSGQLYEYLGIASWNMNAIIDQNRSDPRPWALGSNWISGVGLNGGTFCISLYELHTTMYLSSMSRLWSVSMLTWTMGKTWKKSASRKFVAFPLLPGSTVLAVSECGSEVQRWDLIFVHGWVKFLPAFA